VLAALSLIEPCPQHDASAGGYINIVRKLLAVCPQLVREVDDDDELALVSPGTGTRACTRLWLTQLSHAQHCAARGGFPDVVAALLEAGADKTKLNHEGATPLECCDASDEATAALLAV
jgi:hypothetical protein